MKNRYWLIAKGFFPETLPPCFVSSDFQRAIRGIVADIDDKKFHKRPTEYIRYSGTKHDGNRRFFGTPHPISYFYVSTFVHKHWKKFERQFQISPFSVSAPKIPGNNADRSIQVSSLSEIAAQAQIKLRYAPYILKTDISQFFPSIYTHSISWAAHGIEASKADQSPKSNDLIFNQLDFFTRNCQSAQTRGVLVGPDAFRPIAEFVASSIDKSLHASVGNLIVGAVRHVDDFYIGLRTESDALVVLSQLRETLQKFELQINDSKTRIYNSLDPINDLWAQEIRKLTRETNSWHSSREDLIYTLDRSLRISSEIGSQSPIKIVLRHLDQIKVYDRDHWDVVESYLQRICHHHPHCIDYVALLVVKRKAIGGQIDSSGWQEACQYLLLMHLAFNHHHEIVWLLWLLLSCRIDISDHVADELSKSQNGHVQALLLYAYKDERLRKKPSIKFASKLFTEDADWLTNLVARSIGITKASFSGKFASEFEHLADRKLALIDIEGYVSRLGERPSRAISRTRYGYDDDEGYESDNDDDSDGNDNEGEFTPNPDDDY
ncbi:RNA-directed DNA polymerase [Phyllobacterium chamaecytisi]|uniref:RNA-directed DNA polymerase n=1 Tax=Phyllobacterium chamaecytisi TaxID=2876082 RepID=UPI001CCB759B|nr:RNA-directed DNA polymerase [Phyllobacterium sp. KW56]MBZ9603335.1 RNA-directed DNA polymerase [Phyllobacterium sp. KW56]